VDYFKKIPLAFRRFGKWRSLFDAPGALTIRHFPT
jgi:hypothetical protein